MNIHSTLVHTTIAALLSAAPLSAFPTFMGVYGDYDHHDGGNPGTFSILMNEDYWGLEAELGQRINDGDWHTVPMAYQGNVGGDSLWQYTPPSGFTFGTVIEYYFHGYDTYGSGDIYDNRNGWNYFFQADSGPSQPDFTAAESYGGFLTATDGTRLYDLAPDGGSYRLGIAVPDENGTVWQSAGVVNLADPRALAAAPGAILAVGVSGNSVVVHRSTDDGTIFVPSASLASGAEAIGTVALTALADDEFYLSWIQGDVLNGCRSSSQGGAWGAVTAIDSPATYVELQANSSGMTAVYSSGDTLKAARSADGQQWVINALLGGLRFFDMWPEAWGFAVAEDASFIKIAGSHNPLWRVDNDGTLSDAAMMPSFGGSWPELGIAPDGALVAFMRNTNSSTTSTQIITSFKSSDLGETWTHTGAVNRPGDRVVQKVLSAGDRVHLRWGDRSYQSGGASYFQSSLPVQWQAEPVARLADGSWTTPAGSDGACDYAEANAWIDIAIADLGSTPEVGVVWTADGWNTWQLAYGSLVGALPDGSLQYHVEIAPAGTVATCSGVTTPVEVEYAAFHFVDGEEYWDNNGSQNYQIAISE